MTVVVRVAAFVVAIGLVVAAVVVRTEPGDGGTGTSIVGGGAMPGTCVAQLEDLCRAASGDEDVDWEVEPAADAARMLEEERPQAVVLPAAWADVVDDARVRAGRSVLTRSDVLAATPLLVVGFEERAEVLAAACDVPVDGLGWDCIGEHAGRSWESLGGDVRWGSVVVGHEGPDSAIGLQATAVVVAARTGTPFSLAELREVDFTSWFGRVERAVADFDPPGGSHLTAMVTRGPSVANVAMATEAQTITRGLDTAFGRIVVAAPEPLVDVELVVAGTDADLVRRLAAALDPGALAEAGWRVDGSTPAGAPLADLPARTPSPDGGVLTAVRSMWEDVAG